MLSNAINESGLENCSKYFEIDEFHKALNSNNQKDTNFFHMNIFSLPITYFFLLSLPFPSCQWRRSVVFVSFEHISNLDLVFLLSTLILPAGLKPFRTTGLFLYPLKT